MTAVVHTPRHVRGTLPDGQHLTVVIYNQICYVARLLAEALVNDTQQAVALSLIAEPKCGHHGPDSRVGSISGQLSRHN